MFFRRVKFKFIIAAVFAVFANSQVSAAAWEYASQKWWDYFWESSDGWGKPNPRVLSVLESLDGSKPTITLVDIGAGNGRNSLLALMQLYGGKKPKSNFVVHCIDSSEAALNQLSGYSLPDGLQLVTPKVDVNRMNPADLPESDLLLLYGILEYVKDENLSSVLEMAAKSLHTKGYLMVVTLVQGKGALEIDGEKTRLSSEYTYALEELKGLKFVDVPKVGVKHDCHDLGNGYPEAHLHYVYRTLLTTANDR